MKKKTRKKAPRRSKALSFYFAYIFIVTIVMTLVLGILYFKLAAYQKEVDAEKEAETLAAQSVIPEKPDTGKAAQLAFEEYTDGMDAEWWTEQWQLDRPEDPEAKETILGYFSERLASEKSSLYLDLYYSENMPVYKVKLGDKDAARIFMKKTGGDGSSPEDWTVSDVAILVKGEYDAEAELPDGMNILCNGLRVSPLDTEEDTASYFPYSGIRDLLENPVSWRSCRVAGMLREPEVSYDSSSEYFYSEEDNCYLLLADDVPEDLTQRAEDFFRAYMVYTMSGGAGWKDYKKKKEEALEAGLEPPANPVMGRLNACCSYIPADSVAYTMLYKAFDSTCYALAYTDQDVGLMERRGPIRWADNCVSVEFIYHAYATLNNERKDYSGGDQLFRVFFIKKDDKWRIWAFSA